MTPKFLYERAARGSSDRDHGAIDPVLQRGGRLGGKHV